MRNDLQSTYIVKIKRNKNNVAAGLIGKACYWVQYADLWVVDKGKCILKNIAKAKSDGSAKNIEKICE